MSKKRRFHSPEFKSKFALAVIKGDRTLSELFRQYGINGNLIVKWKKQLTVICFILLVLAVIFRAPSILLEPRFWAEEGSLYFAHATQSGIFEGIFFSPKNTAGYFLLAASVPATFAAHLSSLEFAPFITTYFSFFILLLVFSLVLWGKSYFWNTFILRISVCLIILFFPSSNATGEIWLNTINLQVYCGLIVLVIAFENTKIITNTKKWFLRSIIIFSVLSGVYAMFLTPIYFIKHYYERSQESFIHLLVILSGSVVQVSAFAYIKYSGLISAKKLVLFSWPKSSLYVLTHQITLPLFGNYLGMQFLDNVGLAGALKGINEQNLQYALLAGLVSLIIIIVPMVFLLLKRKNYINIQLVSGFILLAVLTSIFSTHGMPAGRYAVLPSIVYGLLLLRFVTCDLFPKPLKLSLKLILMCSILVGAYEFQFKTAPQFTGNNLPRPDWVSEVHDWRKNSDLNLNMWPYPRWKGRISSLDEVKALKQQFNNINNIYLESDGGWNVKSLNIHNGVPSVFSFQFDVEIMKHSNDSVLHILLLGELNKSMRWMAVDLSDKQVNKEFLVRIDSRRLNRRGDLKMSDVNKIVFRLKSKKGTTALELRNIQHKSPYSAFINVL